MQKELLFGAAYYPEYMPYERIDTDFSMMKKAGMNVIRVAESTWSTLEPKDGEFDYTYIDQILKKAEEYGLQVIVGTPTYAIPSWMADAHPEVMVMTAAGRQIYGRRQIMDITDPVFLRYAERVIRKLISHVADHSCVIGYQIDNETKYYDNSSELLHQKFREHLQQKFGTTEKLNQAYGLAYWSNSISDWEHFPNPDGTINAGIAGEYDRFRRHLVTEYLQWQADIVSEYKSKEQFITQNFDFDWKGYSYGVQTDVNHYEASSAVTLAGCDIYHPSQDALTGAEIAFGGDMTRCLKMQPYLTIETQAQAFKPWTPYPGQLHLQAYSHLASGAIGMMYWNWHSIHNSMETYWKGVLSHDLQENPVYLEACQIGTEWKKLSPELQGMKKENRVALVVDNHSLTALKWFGIDPAFTYNDAVRLAYDSLYELNIECDILDVNALNTMGTGQYDMLITPALYSATEETIHNLKAFAAAGGVLVSTLRSFVSDDHFSVYPDLAPHAMNDVFGMYYQEIADPGKTTVEGSPAKYMLELLQVTDAEVLMQYEHKYWGAYAAVTENTFGKGKAYYIGTVADKKIWKKIFAKARKDVFVIHPDRQRPLSENYEWPVIIRNGMGTDGSMLHYIMNYSEQEQAIDCPYAQVKDLLTEQIFAKGDVINLHDWDVKVMKQTGKMDD